MNYNEFSLNLNSIYKENKRIKENHNHNIKLIKSNKQKFK